MAASAREKKIAVRNERRKKWNKIKNIVWVIWILYIG